MTCIRPLFAYIGSVAIGFTNQEGKAGTLDRAVSTVVIADAIIAAVRLAKVADFDLSVTRVITTVQQSVRLARTILEEVMRR
jgi:hypothetical protein